MYFYGGEPCAPLFLSDCQRKEGYDKVHRRARRGPTQCCYSWQWKMRSPWGCFRGRPRPCRGTAMLSRVGSAIRWSVTLAFMEFGSLGLRAYLYGVVEPGEHFVGS